MHSIVATALAAISLHSNALPQTCPDAMERTAYLMGTTLRVRACGERQATAAAIEAGFQEVARLEQVLSSWKSSTEIGRINSASPATRVPLSAELMGLLTEAGHWVAVTDGAFDPAIGALIDCWGFRSEAHVPAEPALARALSISGWQRARLEDDAMVRGPHGWWLDTGAFGKGAALRSVAAVLRQHGVSEAVLDFGGQLHVMGAAAVSIADPAQRDRAARLLRVRDVSVSTSSQSERFIESAGRKYGHILDPRTGRPVEAWGSVTVVASDALAADALSTALFVMGPKAALAWAEQHADVGVLVLETGHDDVRATWNRALNQWLTLENR